MTDQLFPLLELHVGIFEMRDFFTFLASVRSCMKEKEKYVLSAQPIGRNELCSGLVIQ